MLWEKNEIQFEQIFFWTFNKSIMKKSQERKRYYLNTLTIWDPKEVIMGGVCLVDLTLLIVK